MQPIPSSEPSLTSPLAPSLDIQGVMEILPHRYPMLLLDGLRNIVPGERAVGIKSVTINEPFFQGHFPGKPIMPGVLIIEALAQTAGALVMHTLGATHHNHLVYFLSITEARFRKVVEPGCIMHLHVTKQHHRANVWRFSGEAWVDDKVVTQATFTAMITPRLASPS